MRCVIVTRFVKCMKAVYVTTYIKELNICWSTHSQLLSFTHNIGSHPSLMSGIRSSSSSLRASSLFFDPLAGSLFLSSFFFPNLCDTRKHKVSPRVQSFVKKWWPNQPVDGSLSPHFSVVVVTTLKISGRRSVGATPSVILFRSDQIGFSWKLLCWNQSMLQKTQHKHFFKCTDYTLAHWDKPTPALVHSLTVFPGKKRWLPNDRYGYNVTVGAGFVVCWHVKKALHLSHGIWSMNNWTFCPIKSLLHRSVWCFFLSTMLLLPSSLSFCRGCLYVLATKHTCHLSLGI